MPPSRKSLIVILGGPISTVTSSSATAVATAAATEEEKSRAMSPSVGSVSIFFCVAVVVSLAGVREAKHGAAAAGGRSAAAAAAAGSWSAE